TLRELDLSWNNISRGSANVLGAAVASAQLTILRLAHNKLGCEGCQRLAHALRRNEMLRTLDLSFTGMSARAALVMASALRDNKTLSRLGASHNPLSRSGARALLQAVRQRA
ncbi:unnamed protein product, partial [Phaeothamnion confervicola]